ncbi:HTH_Tnp_Tc3_2 domain-containing protein [Trichonephila clavipes]|nr:HTH_Tnp_Tc3_2 domain-containing protein [Trichonephila clavipes]
MFVCRGCCLLLNIAKQHLHSHTSRRFHKWQPGMLARWIVRSVPLEIVGSSGHEKVPMREKPGLERPGRPRGERIVRQALVDLTVTRSTIRADVGVAIVPQTISRHFAEANLKSKRPFRALPLTSATASTVVPSQINVECHRLAKGCV